MTDRAEKEGSEQPPEHLLSDGPTPRKVVSGCTEAECEVSYFTEVPHSKRVPHWKNFYTTTIPPTLAICQNIVRRLRTTIEYALDGFSKKKRPSLQFCGGVSGRTFYKCPRINNCFTTSQMFFNKVIE
jgi:hypothetical protein